MIKTRAHELPQELKSVKDKTIKLEWITIAFLISVIALMYVVMGNSQAMKSAWIEDALGLVPPIVYLISQKILKKEPNKEYPYGYHGVTIIAFLIGSVALSTAGLFLLIDSAMSLLNQEHPSIGLIKIFGYDIWLGWCMIAVLIWSVVPAVILGRKKLPLAKKLHNKVLNTDAQMNKADWLTGVAAIAGIIGIGIGWWWADAVAALIISIDILWDGFKNVKTAISDLLDRIPKTVDHEKTDEIVTDLKVFLQQMPWIKEVEIRLREEGQVYFGEAFVVPNPNTPDLPAKIEETIHQAYQFHWRIHDLTIMPLQKLPQTNLIEE